MHSGENVCDMVVLSSSMLDSTVKGHVKDLPSSEFVALWCSLHEGEQGIVICQDYKLVYCQFSFKKV